MNGDWDDEVDFAIDARRGSAKLLEALLRYIGKEVDQAPQVVVPLKRVGGLSPVAKVQNLTAQLCELPVRIMTNGEPTLVAVQARQIAMYLAVVVLGKNKSEVARRFNVDRTTVYHAVQRVCKTDALWQKSQAVKALLTPVDNGEKPAISATNSPENARTKPEHYKKESLAA